MKRFNDYLLTHYPLLWNTRIVWVFAANFTIHLLFFLTGLASVHVKSLVNYSSYERVGGEGMYTFSVLCALVVLIVWCVYYLRNNAFKSFYRLPKFYLAKEFGLVFLIVLTSISYSQSFEWGVKLRVRSITGEEEMVREMNVVNDAMAYVPMEMPPYFVLNNCEERAKDSFRFYDVTPLEAGESYHGLDSAAVIPALRRTDAYSYANYCTVALPYSAYPLDAYDAIGRRNRQRLTQGRRDSVKQSIERLFAVLNKYGVGYRLDADSLTKNVFASPDFAVAATIPKEQYRHEYGQMVENRFYLNEYEVSRLFDFIEDCQPGAHNWEEIKTAWNVIGYVALSFSVLLLCYRRFSRKVFLISVIGTLVWSILVGLLTMGGDKNGFVILLLLLCAGFLAGALGLLAQRGNKTVAGVLLNWHIYLAPFVVMLLTVLIDDYRDGHRHNFLKGYTYSDEEMRLLYPFSTWVMEHTMEIFLVNIVVVGLYAAFVFNGLAKRWHLLPEE